MTKRKGGQLTRNILQLFLGAGQPKKREKLSEGKHYGNYDI